MVKTDYPWVRSYDKIAKNDAEALSTNSEVLIDGFINSRIPTRKLTCEACGHSLTGTIYQFLRSSHILWSI